MSIADLPVGDVAIVTSVEPASASARQRLLALGIVPGEKVVVEQRSPAIVVRVGWTRVALDRETAEKVLVRPEPVTRENG